MKRLITQLLINIITGLNKPYDLSADRTKLCRIKADDRFLYAIMPNGEAIPGQIDISIKQPLRLRGLAVVTCTFYVDFENLIDK